ncbi:hypothetical protein [Pelosinus propionicus]|uniref:Uncharacterized protein n=1 Tax=Pelosinus propionicus DSM 13327 TaxID=1123291 RepID=A0A1I4QF20_9FIRM|nr:hypothetical protein [Pelosinus propionicus]SFM38240.1 hypothetical protein SAMN04490355_10961 [Pelosinus propionicus DSM 13327]
MRLIDRIRQAEKEYEKGEYVIWEPGMFAKSKSIKSVRVRQRTLKNLNKKKIIKENNSKKFF